MSIRKHEGNEKHMIKKLSTPRVLFVGVMTAAFLSLTLTVKIAAENLGWGFSFEEGTVVKSQSSGMKIAPLDLTPEPGEISSDEDLALFYERQNAFAAILSTGDLILERDGSASVVSRRSGSLFDLPALFWIQIAVGLGSFIISGWVWALRSRDLAPRLFALSGLSTLLFTFASAIYTTRELALPERLFKFLVGINVIGASMFGIATLSLFLVYPLRFSKWGSILTAQVTFFGAWTLLSLAGALPPWAGVNLITLVEMVGICAALAGQFFLTKGHPKERASLSWLGLSVLAGAGGFITLNALPLVLGTGAAVPQGYAFLFFLVIYLGLAAGITRYRLFDVGSWAFRFLFYSLGALLLVLLDAALISLLELDRFPALALSFFAIGLLYLPFRDWIQGFLRRGVKLKSHDLIDAAIQVALGPTPAERTVRWKSLILRLLDPLEVLPASDTSGSVRIHDDGTALYIPPLGEIPAMTVKFPWSGKSLFSKETEQLVQRLVTLVEQAESSRTSYERGIQEERIRIAQDLHDDVGARLLNGLYASESNLRTTIQEAIADLRSIVSGISGDKVHLSHFLADLRHETQGRCTAAGIEVNWPVYDEALFEHHLDYRVYRTLGSSIREIVSNVIKHSGADLFQAHVEVSNERITLKLSDNGSGISQKALDGETEGCGLMILRRRISELNGQMAMCRTDLGTEIKICIPMG